MPAVRDLLHVRFAARGTMDVHRPAVPGNNFDTGIGGKPTSQRVRYAIRQEGNGLVARPLGINWRMSVGLVQA